MCTISTLLKSNKMLPYLALVLGLLSLSITPFFIRWADAPGPVTVFFRVVVATLVLAPFFIHSIKKDPLKIDRQMLIAPALGGLCMALDLIFWSSAVQYTYVSTATLLGNTSPLWVALAAWLIFHEKIKKVFWIGLALAMLGSIAVVGGDLFIIPDIRSVTGDVLGLLSGLFYAGYLIAGQVGRKNSATIRYIWMMYAAGAVSLFAFVLIKGWSFTDYSPQTWMVFVASGLLAGVVGYFSVIYALGHLPASIVSPTLIAQPVLVAILGVPLVGELLKPYQWLGGLVVIAGILLVHRSREKEPTSHEVVTPEIVTG